MNAFALSLPRVEAAVLGLMLCCASAAAIVAGLSVSVNRERACAWRESLVVESCAQPAPGSAEEVQMLRARIERDPGDANAYVQLAVADRSARRTQLVEIASRLAPREPNLLLARAAYAIEHEDWAAAVPPLVELADHRDLIVAADALGEVVLQGQAALLEPYLKPGTMWLQRTLGSMRAHGLPFSGALPLVIRAVRLGVIDVDTVRGYVRDLKARGAWADAYALWLSLHGTSVPLLFNANFDHAFELDGFDWEVPVIVTTRRPGVVIERRRAEQRGAVLNLQFSGRAFTLPIVRQYLFIAPGHYRLRGDYLARQFRSEEGLAWVVRCASSSVAGRSGQLRETLGLWQSFEFEFAVPPDCGTVASLQLESANAADAALGARGRVSFDAFSLERTGS